MTKQRLGARGAWLRAAVTAGVIAAAAGCGDDDAGPDDAGRRDAAAALDASTPVDASTLDASTLVDAQTGVDAAIDAEVDAQIASDAQVEPRDAGDSDAGDATDPDGGTPLAPGVSTLAGDGTIGTADGAGGSARFHQPTALAVDRDGSLLVADAGSSRIRRVTLAGVVTTVASGAPIAEPQGIAVGADGTIFVANRGNHTIVRIPPGGSPELLAGAAGSSGMVDATGAAARFNAPRGIAVDTDGSLLVADSSNGRIRRVVTSGAELGAVSTVAGTAGFTAPVDGPIATAVIYGPYAIAVLGEDDLLIAGQDSCVRRIAEGTVTRIAGLCGNVLNNGTADGAAIPDARFDWPRGLAQLADGTVVIADTGNHLVRALSADRTTVETIAGTLSAGGSPVAGFADGAALGTAQLSTPIGVVAGPDGAIYIADQQNHRIRRLVL